MKKIRQKYKESRIVRIATVVAFAGILILPPALHAADPSKLAAELARLRTEVEELASDVESRKDEMRGQLRSYAAQKADLEMELQREEMRLRQIREAKAKRIERMDDDSQRNELLKPVIERSAEVVATQILAGMPFQKEERQAAVNKIKRQNQDGLLRSADAVARLWDRVEDEFRMARENGLYRQVITLGDEEMLVDVARVGMVMLFFKTKDGQVGKAVKQGGKWAFVSLPAKEDKEQVLNLFDSFKKQIRSGFFLLPGSLSSSEGKP